MSKFVLMKYEGIAQVLRDSEIPVQYIFPDIRYKQSTMQTVIEQEDITIKMPNFRHSEYAVHQLFSKALEAKGWVSHQYLFDCVAVVPEDKYMFCDSKVLGKYPFYAIIDSKLKDDLRVHYFWLLKLNTETLKFENTKMYEIINYREMPVYDNEIWHRLLVRTGDIQKEDTVNLSNITHYVSRYE